MRGSQTLLPVLLAMILASAAPSWAQQEEPRAADEGQRETRTVTFYPHVFFLGTGGPMPGNTQYPWGDDDWSRGLASFVAPMCEDTVGGASPGVVVTDCDSYGLNVLYVYSTAGFVDVHNLQEWNGDYSKFHNERGQAKDIALDTTQDVTATIYMSADFHGWLLCTDNFPGAVPAGTPWPFPCWNWDPGAYPDWQVEATLFTANMGEYQGQASEPPPVDEKVASGDVVEVARGVSDPVQIVSLDDNLPGGFRTVYEINVNLGKPKVDTIPKEQDWIMRYRWWMNGPSGRTVLPNPPINWNVNSGEFYPIRFTLPVKNPFDVELVFPQFIHDKLLVHAIMNSPWGSYDVHSQSVKLTLADAQGVPIDAESLTQLSDYSVAHGGHYKPVNVTWIWDYKADGLAPGVYTATVDACNWQHSACSTVSSVFQLDAAGLGTTVQVGRSGVATFTQEQLKKVQEAAERAAGGAPGDGLAQTGKDDLVDAGRAPSPSKTPGPELGLVGVAIGLTAMGLRLRKR